MSGDLVVPTHQTPTSEFTCLLDYYCSRHAYRYLIQACSTTLSTAPAHPEARFYRGIALVQENNVSDGIRELESLLREQQASNGEYSLACVAALIHAHKQAASTSRRVDRESIEKYKEQLKGLSRNNDLQTLLTAGRYFLHSHKDKQAKQCLDKVLAKQPYHPTANIYLAHLYRRSNNVRNEKKATKLCENVIQSISSEKCDINALLCHTTLMMNIRNYDQALQNLNLIIVHYPNFMPALQEKSTLLFLTQDYEESLVLSYRIIKRDQTHLFALFQIVLYFLVKEGGYSISARERMNDFLAALSSQVSNPQLSMSYDQKEYYYHCSQLIARLAYKNKQILTQSTQMLDTIIKQNNNSSGTTQSTASIVAGRQSTSSPRDDDSSNQISTADNNAALYVIEQAYQYYLLDDLLTSHTLYTQAAKLEEQDNGGHIFALIGKIKIKIKQAKYKEAEQELEFLSDLTGNQVFGAAHSTGSAGRESSGRDRDAGNSLDNDNASNRSGRHADTSKLEVLLLRANLAYFYHLDIPEATQTIQQWFHYYQQHCHVNIKHSLGKIAGTTELASARHQHTPSFTDDSQPYHSLLTLHADLIMEIVELILLILPSEPKQHGDPDHPLLPPSISLLSLLLSIIPGHLTAYLLYSKLLFLHGDFTQAEQILIQRCLSLDPTNAYVHLQLAYIYFYTENYKQSSTNIEQARALDFEVRNTIHYYLMKAKLLRVSGNEEDAIKVLSAALELPGIRKSNQRRLSNNATATAAANATATTGTALGRNVFPVTNGDRLSVYLELSSAYSALNNMTEATKIMNAAKHEFGTISSSTTSTTTAAKASSSGPAAASSSAYSSDKEASTRVLMAEAELSYQRKDYDLALSLYRSVDAENLYYTRCKLKMAEIYLNCKKNKKAFLSCYHDLVLLYPTLNNYLLLAEAYIQISDPDHAIENYEKALQLCTGSSANAVEASAISSSSPENVVVSDIYSRIGHALISTHDYTRAVQYYEHAILEEEKIEASATSTTLEITKQNQDSNTVCKLLYELSSLYLKMRKYEESKGVVERCLSVIKEKKAKTQTASSSSPASPTSASSSASSSDSSYSLVLLLQWEIKCDILSSEIHQELKQHDQVLTYLHQATTLQSDLLTLLTNLSTTLTFMSTLLAHEKEHTSQLYYQLACYYHHTAKNTEQAILYYHESLKINPIFVNSLLALSQLFFAQGEYEQAQQTLLSLLRLQNGGNQDSQKTGTTAPSSLTSTSNNNLVNPNQYRTASLLLAEIMYEKNEYDNAIYHFTSLLENNESRLEALSKMIKILRRSGRLSDAPKYIRICEKAIISGNTQLKLLDEKNKLNSKPDATGKETTDKNQDILTNHTHYHTAPGLHYCKGLYAYYCNNPRESLFHYNLARKDNEWGKLALQHMIEIYLNPDHDDLFIEVTEQSDTTANGANPSPLAKHQDEDKTNNLLAAQKLLQDLLLLSEKTWQIQILECYIYLSNKTNKPFIEKAIATCNEILQQDQNYIPALLCLANAYHLIQNPAKSRNYLKRISKMKIQYEYLYEFEQSYLLLAQIYHELGKFELSTELCKKVITLNKSNGKAWEILGGIMEKEAAYRDAAEHYEMAWKNSNESNLNIGFKLAFNYLKCKKYVECLDICHLLLKQQPDLPKIRKDIMEKARNGLRP